MGHARARQPVCLGRFAAGRDAALVRFGGPWGLPVMKQASVG